MLASVLSLLLFPFCFLACILPTLQVKLLLTVEQEWWVRSSTRKVAQCRKASAITTTQLLVLLHTASRQHGSITLRSSAGNFSCVSQDRLSPTYTPGELEWWTWFMNHHAPVHVGKKCNPRWFPGDLRGINSSWLNIPQAQAAWLQP